MHSAVNLGVAACLSTLITTGAQTLQQSVVTAQDIEFLTVKCRPAYLPREFTVAIITAVYIPPSAETDVALDTLYRSICDLQSRHPEGVIVGAGDLNQAKMKKVLPHYHQYVDCPVY